jgi:hypothetical protein
MPECTEAERAYLEACLKGGLAPDEESLRTAVVTERTTGEVMDKLVSAMVERKEKDAAFSKLWAASSLEHLSHSDRATMYDAICQAANKRLGASE